jgi:hypothetical protein
MFLILKSTGVEEVLCNKSNFSAIVPTMSNCCKFRPANTNVPLELNLYKVRDDSALDRQSLRKLFREMNDLCAIKRASLFNVIDRCNFLRKLTGGNNRPGACCVVRVALFAPQIFASLLLAHAKKCCRDKKSRFFDRLEKQVEN